MTLEGECSSRCCHNNFIAWQQHLLRVNSEGSSGSAAEEVVVRAKAGTAVVHSKILTWQCLCVQRCGVDGFKKPHWC